MWTARQPTWRAFWPDRWWLSAGRGGSRRGLGQLAYAIGVDEPVCIMVEAEGVPPAGGAEIADALRGEFDLTPAGIIRRLDLQRPIYYPTAPYGHIRLEREYADCGQLAPNASTPSDPVTVAAVISRSNSAYPRPRDRRLQRKTRAAVGKPTVATVTDDVSTADNGRIVVSVAVTTAVAVCTRLAQHPEPQPLAESARRMLVTASPCPLRRAPQPA